MVAEARDDKARFLVDGIEEFFVLGIDGASHVEVLPHHDAGLVAEVEEAIFGIDVATPATGHIAVRFRHQFDSAIKVQVVAAVQTIKATVVGAFYKDRHAVDSESELALAIRSKQ